MAEKANPRANHPCPCTHPELPQFKCVSVANRVLLNLHTGTGILTSKECSECASKEWNWHQLTAIVIATKCSDVVQEALRVVRRQRAFVCDPTVNELTRLIKVLSTLYQERMVTEQEVEDLRPLLRAWDSLVNIQCTKSPDVVKRTAELLAEVGHNEEGKRFKVLSTLYQERIVTEQEVEDLKPDVWPWDRLVGIQFRKPCDVGKRTAELIAEVACNENVKCLKVLSTLSQEKMLTEQEIENLRPLPQPWDRIVEIQCTKPNDVVKKTAELLAEVKLFAKGKRLQVLSTLYQEKMVTEQEMEELKPIVWPWNRLVEIQCTKSRDVVKGTAELLVQVGCNEEGKHLKVLSTLYQEKIVTEQEMEDLRLLLQPWSRLVEIQCTKPRDVVDRTAELLAEVECDKEGKRLEVLSTLYQKKIITEQEVEYLKHSVSPWGYLVQIQCTKPPDVMERTAEMLPEVGCNEEATLLKVLAALLQKKVIPQHVIQKWKGDVSNKLLDLILVQYSRPSEDVATTADVLDMFRFKEDADMLRVLSVLHQKKMITHHEVMRMCREVPLDALTTAETNQWHVVKFHGVGKALFQDLVNVHHYKPLNVVITTAKVLDELGLKEEATQFRESQRESSRPQSIVSLATEAGGGSNPPEREDTSNLLTDEAALKRLCWIPFGVMTASIEAKGGTVCLEPASDDAIQAAKVDTISVEVPPDAVDTSADVKMRYAIIPSGPFVLPKGYQFGSPVVYIYYDGRRVTKPFKLKLPHWYGGEDHTRDGLSFAIASHTLKRGTTTYQFQLIGGGTFSKDQQLGIFHIDGHSTLFADVLKEKSTSVYLATHWEQRLASQTNTRIVITYKIEMWLKILKQYWVDWNRDTAATVDFLFERRWFSKRSICGELSNVRGQEWKATLVNSEVYKDDVRYHGRYTEDKLGGLVKEGVYPPSIKCAVLYNSPRDFERPSLDTFDMKIEGTNKHHVSFPVKVYSAIVSYPPHTLVPARTEATSQPSLSLWEAGLPMTEWNRDALIFLKGELKLNVSVKESGMLDMLAMPTPLGFFNQTEMQTIATMANNMDRMDTIVNILLGKEDKCFSNFCKILAKNNCEVWANTLRKKADELRRGPVSPAQSTHTGAAHTFSVCSPLSEATSSVSHTSLSSTQSTQPETSRDLFVCPSYNWVSPAVSPTPLSSVQCTQTETSNDLLVCPPHSRPTPVLPKSSGQDPPTGSESGDKP